MKRIALLISLLIAACLLMSPAQSLESLGAYWQSLPSPGQSLEHSITVSLSQEESPALITVSLLNCSLDQHGEIQASQEESSQDLPSAQPWLALRLSNQSLQESSQSLSFMLQPGSSQEIIASAQIPAQESLQGGYYAMINILGSPQEKSRHKLGQIKTQLAINCMVAFDLGYEDFSAEIPELSYADGNLSMQISNTGNYHFQPRILIETGSITKELAAENQSPLFPGASRLIKLPLGLQAGQEIRAQVFRADEELLAEEKLTAEAWA